MNIIKRTYNFRTSKCYLMTFNDSLPSRFWKAKILKSAKILNSGFWNAKILEVSQNLEFKILESYNSNFVYWFYCKRNTCILYVSFLNNIALKIVANNIEYEWQLTVFYYYYLFSNTLYFYCNLFCYLPTYLFTYLFFYFMLCINVVNLLPIKK